MVAESAVISPAATAVITGGVASGSLADSSATVTPNRVSTRSIRLAIAKVPSELPAKRSPTGLRSGSVTKREPESPPRMKAVPVSTMIWSTNSAVPESYPIFTVTLMPVISPFVCEVVRPYFWTFWPRIADTIVVSGVP